MIKKVVLNIVEKKKSSKLFKNLIYNGIGWFSGIILNFIATPYIVSKMGLNAYGMYALVTAIISYLSIMDLGIGQSIVKFVSEYNSSNNTKRLVDTINNAVSVLILAGVIGAFLIVIFNQSFLNFFKVMPSLMNDTKKALFFSAIIFVLTLTISGISSVLNGLQRFDITSKLTMAYNIALIIGTVVILFFKGGLSQVMLCNAVLLVALTYFYFFYVKKLITGYTFNFKISKITLRPLLNFSIFLVVSRIAGLAFTQLDKVFIGSIIGTAAVSFYAVPSRLLNSLLMGVAVIGTTIMPRISELSASNDSGNKTAKLYIDSTQYLVLLVTPIFLIFILLSKRFMTFWMGEIFAENSWFLTSIIAVSFYLSATTNILWNVALGMGKSKLQAYFSLAITVISLGLLYPFTKKWGVNGTPFSILVSCIIVPFTFYYFNKRIFFINQLFFLKRVFLGPILASLICGVVIWKVNRFFNISFWSLLTMGLIILVVYAAIVFVIKRLVKL